MISRRKEPEGKPFMRVPLDRPPVKKPMSKKSKKPVESQPAGDPMKAIDRANRSQAMEAKEMKMVKKPMKKYSKGGGTYGPPASGSGGSSAGQRGGLSSSGRNYRLQDLGPPPTAGGGGNTTINPSLRGGMPGVKVKSKFAKGGSTCGGMTKKMAKGGMVSKRADGKAMRGKTKCKMV